MGQTGGCVKTLQTGQGRGITSPDRCESQTMTSIRTSLFASFTLLSAACGQTSTEPPAQSAAAPQATLQTDQSACTQTVPCTPLQILEALSADEMGGRQTGTEGNAKARAFLRNRFAARGLEARNHEFTFETREGDTLTGINLLARIEGKTDGPFMVVTAHYDHVGTHEGQIFNGADDNASGVAGAFAVADHFRANPPEHDVVIALLDAEEMGLQGAHALVRDGLGAGGDIALNVNFDMLSRNDKNELYAAGAFHRPDLAPLLKAIAADAPVALKLGHDDPALGSDDWTLQSDHGPFHQAGIPFVYFGVEDHQDYHQPTDVFETVPQDFFLRSIETVIMAAEMFDAELVRINSTPDG